MKFRFYYIETKNNKKFKYYKDFITTDVTKAKKMFNNYILNKHFEKIQIIKIEKFIYENDKLKIYEIKGD